MSIAYRNHPTKAFKNGTRPSLIYGLINEEVKLTQQTNKYIFYVRSILTFGEDSLIIKLANKFLISY